ncbi:ABC transporter permease [bacterium B17]|nr:ABC transporter permease [bacterium B17]
MQNKKTIMLLLLPIISALCIVLCLFIGSSGIGFPDTNTDPGKTILMMRINRIVSALIVGAALSTAGVIFQALLRNPLAEPYVLGVSSGAGLGAAMCIIGGLSSAMAVSLPVAAFVGGAITLALVFGLATNNGATSIYGLILSGVIVSSICSSILMFLVATAPVAGLHSVIWWMLGNLQPKDAGLLSIIAVTISLGIICSWCISPELNAMTLGKEAAHNIGVRTRMIMIIGLGLATLITAAAVSLSGLIGFVGLIVPHVMRNIVGPDHRKLIPTAALCGGIFLAICDAIARSMLLIETPMPVGVITAICGGPFFLAILRKRRRTRWTE